MRERPGRLIKLSSLPSKRLLKLGTLIAFMGEKPVRVCISGYFNPLHVGHLAYMKAAKALGDELIVIVNSDKQVRVKGRVPFMSEEDRLEIVKAIRYVDEAVLSIDADLSVCRSLAMVKPDIFANGGDRHEDNIPEKEVCETHGIRMVDGVGGGKLRHSSEIIKQAQGNQED